MQHIITTSLQGPKLHWEEQGHHRRLCCGRSWRWHPQGAPPRCLPAGSTSSPSSRACSAVQSRCPNLQLPYLFRNVCLLPNFPMAHGSTVIQKCAGRCLAASSSAAALAGHTQFESKQTISLKWATPAKFLITHISISVSRTSFLLYGAMVKQALQHNIPEQTLVAFRTI